MSGAQCRDRCECGEGADSPQTQRGGPKHHWRSQEGNREGLEDGGRLARERSPGKRNYPAVETRNCEPDSVSGARPRPFPRRGKHRQRATETERRVDTRGGSEGAIDDPHLLQSRTEN